MTKMLYNVKWQKSPNDASGEALWRRIQRPGLTDDYKSNSDLGQLYIYLLNMKFVQQYTVKMR